MRLRCYDLSGTGGGGIHSWHKDLSGEIQAEIDAALEDLSLDKDWNSHPITKELRGACAGLWEIMLDTATGRRFRVLGFLYRAENLFFCRALRKLAVEHLHTAPRADQPVGL